MVLADSQKTAKRDFVNGAESFSFWASVYWLKNKNISAEISNSRIAVSYNAL